MSVGRIDKGNYRMLCIGILPHKSVALVCVMGRQSWPGQKSLGWNPVVGGQGGWSAAPSRLALSLGDTMLVA
jgi:hypothetical protein